MGGIRRCNLSNRFFVLFLFFVCCRSSFCVSLSLLILLLVLMLVLLLLVRCGVAVAVDDDSIIGRC